MVGGAFLTSANGLVVSYLSVQFISDFVWYSIEEKILIFICVSGNSHRLSAISSYGQN